MIHALLVLLGCQLAGEAAARAAGLPLPGPVLGMALLVVGLAVVPGLAGLMRGLVQGILGNLSLLFVPAGVGVVGHLDRLGAQGAMVLLAVVGSTGLGIAAAALTFRAVARLTGRAGD